MLSLLCSLKALLNAVFLKAIVCSASAWFEPPLNSRWTMRLCSTRLAGTLNSAKVGAGLAVEVDSLAGIPSNVVLTGFDPDACASLVWIRLSGS